MTDLKDLQNMAKSGEFSEKLLSDENFKAEFKKIIKDECGMEIKDEDIPEVIKNIEKSLKENAVFDSVPEGGENALSEAQMETVSGGINRDDAIRGVSTVVGAVASGILTNVVMNGVNDYKYNKDKDKLLHEAVTKGGDAFDKAFRKYSKLSYEKGQTRDTIKYSATPLGVIGGAFLGRMVGDLIVDKLNSEENSKE